MQLNPLATNNATTTTAGSSSNPSSSTSTDEMSGMFMQLLTTQLMNQDPLNPIDPSQFTDQLVQFNMLDQLTQINATLQSEASNGPSSSQSGSGSGSGDTSHSVNSLIGGI